MQHAYNVRKNHIVSLFFQEGVLTLDDHGTLLTTFWNQASIWLKENELDIEALKLPIELKKLKLQGHGIKERERGARTRESLGLFYYQCQSQMNWCLCGSEAQKLFRGA